VDLPALVIPRDLESRGYSRSEARKHLGQLTRIAPGSYARTEGLVPEQVHRLRTDAVLRRVTNVVVSHTSAALLWGLPLMDGHLHLVHVSRTTERVGRPKSGTGYRMHSRAVPDERTVWAGRFPASDPLLTVLDCARFLDPDWGVVIADAALHADLITPGDLAEAADHLPRQPGVGRARRLPLVTSALSESPGESLLRLRLRRMGLDVQEQVQIGAARVDLLVAGGVVVEFDGRAKYGLTGDREQAHWAEKIRNDRLVERGHEIVHVVWADLWDEVALRHRIETALRRWRRRHGRTG
jgi:hypothetical protein